MKAVLGPHGDAAKSPGATSSGTYLPELEGLRGLAILLVVLLHSEGIACLFIRSVGEPCASAPVGFLAGGHTGVTLFFVLSGFLLSLPFFRQAAGGREVSAWDFYRRRALRILPLYWGVLLVGVALDPSTEILLGTLPYVVFVNGIWKVPFPGPHTNVMWSLATEVQFYVVLPLLFLRVGTRSRVPLGVPILAVFALAYVLFVAGLFGLGSRVVAQSIVGRGPVFLCGMAAAWVYARYGTRLRAWRPLAVGGDLALVASLVALEALLRVIAPTAREWESAPYAAWHVPEGMLWALVLLLIVIAPLRLRVVFVNPVLMRLGVISYSIYLLHWPVLHWAGKLVHSPLVLATGAPCARARTSSPPSASRSPQ